jgi:hypothetical protein
MLLDRKQGMWIFNDMIMRYLNKNLHSDWVINSFCRDKDESGVFIIEFSLKKGQIEKGIIFKLSFGTCERTLHFNPIFENLLPETAKAVMNLFNALNFNMRTLTS